MRKLITLAVLVFSGCATFQSDKFVANEYGTDDAHPKPTILIAHGCAGVGAWDSMMTALVKSWGFNAVVVDGNSKRRSNDCSGKVISEMDRLDDLIAMSKIVKQQKWHKGKIGVVGMSRGATTALTSGSVPKAKAAFDAAVAYYPMCQLDIRYNYTKPNFPVQVHIGEQDDWTPCIGVYAFEWGWAHYDTYFYPNATHSFDVPAATRVYLGHHLSYDVEAAQLAHQRTKEFFQRYLNGE